MDWISDHIYVCDEKGAIYLVKVDLPTEGKETLDVQIAVIYNGTSIPRALQVHPSKG